MKGREEKRCRKTYEPGLVVHPERIPTKVPQVAAGTDAQFPIEKSGQHRFGANLPGVPVRRRWHFKKGAGDGFHERRLRFRRGRQNNVGIEGTRMPAGERGVLCSSRIRKASTGMLCSTMRLSSSQVLRILASPSRSRPKPRRPDTLNGSRALL